MKRNQNKLKLKSSATLLRIVGFVLAGSLLNKSTKSTEETRNDTETISEIILTQKGTWRQLLTYFRKCNITHNESSATLKVQDK